jgi:hypothetical protein
VLFFTAFPIAQATMLRKFCILPELVEFLFKLLQINFLGSLESYLTLSLKFTSQLLSLLVSDLADVQFCKFCGDNIVRIFVAGFLPFALNLSCCDLYALIIMLDS